MKATKMMKKAFKWYFNNASLAYKYTDDWANLCRTAAGNGKA